MSARIVSDLRAGRSVRITGRAEDNVNGRIVVECDGERLVVIVFGCLRVRGLGHGDALETRVRLAKGEGVDDV